MPGFTTFNELRQWAEKMDEAVVLKTASASLEHKNVFLSHCSKDHPLLLGVIRILQNHGAKVYIDDEDRGLPEDISVETAARLKKTIYACRKFVVFVTTNSKDSLWIPWELGLGSGLKGDDHIALYPSAEHSYETKWAEQEYLGLYRRIVWGNMEGEPEPLWMVYDYRTNTATKLGSWLRT